MAKPQAIFSPSVVQVGDVIGSIELLSTFMRGKGRRFWECKCVVCGNVREIRCDHLERYAGKTDCCCRPHRKHGLSDVREFKIWQRMVERCHNPDANNYRFYGGLGHFVCDRWRSSAEAFIADMGQAPSDSHSIDRIDTLRHYTCGKCEQCKASGEPANCRWVTKHTQARNAKNNRWYTHNGKTLILKDWAAEVGIKYLTLHCRIARGWSFADAITLPVRSLRNNR